MIRRVDRGTFLLVVAGAAAGSAAAWRLLAGGSSHRLFVGLFDDVGAARVVGRAYLQQHPDDGGEAHLLAALSLSEDLPPEVFRRRVAEQVERDYEESRLVLVRGWYLSRTEARICALTTYA